MTKIHTILGGKVRVNKRPESPIWQCSAYLVGKNRRVSTKEESLNKAKDFAEDWYLELRGKSARGEISGEKTFKQAAEKFTLEYEVMTDGERNAKYVEDHQSRLRNHLIPYFGNMGLSEITSGAAQDYRVMRMNGGDGFKPPSRSTMHKEIVTLRLVLKTTLRHQWLAGDCPIYPCRIERQARLHTERGSLLMSTNNCTPPHARTFNNPKADHSMFTRLIFTTRYFS